MESIEIKNYFDKLRRELDKAYSLADKAKKTVIENIKEGQSIESSGRKGMYWLITTSDGKEGYLWFKSANPKSDESKSKRGNFRQCQLDIRRRPARENYYCQNRQ